VLCTIHQPSSEVFDLFDIVMLLKVCYISFEIKPKKGCRGQQ